VVIARPFNHVGPGQHPSYFLPTVARQLRAAKEQGLSTTTLTVGNVEVVRDLTHVDDVCEAYRTLLTHGEPGTLYNIGSGEGRRLRDVIQLLADVSEVHCTLEIDPTRLRPTDKPTLICDATRLRALGWTPKRSITDTLADVLNG
jgi:GDP-4-dehydro-6-deoxy-D-mannose reductase